MRVEPVPWPRRAAYAGSCDGALSLGAAHEGCAASTTSDSTPRAVVVHPLGCPRGVDVEQVVVRGQGHAWPGGEKPWWFSPTPSPLDGASLMLALFARTTPPR